MSSDEHPHRSETGSFVRSVGNTSTMAAPIAVTTIGPVATRPISVPANDQLVALTSGFVGWQPAAAIAGTPQMAVDRSEAAAAFLVRCKLSRSPADMAAAAPSNLLTFNLNDAAWSRILTIIRDGGLALAAPNEPDRLHEYIRAISLPAGGPDPFLINATDWALMPAWAVGPAGAARAPLAAIRFLSLAPLASLEITSGPQAATGAWTLIAKLAGALGPVGSQPARSQEASQLQAVAATIRRYSAGGAADGPLALNLKPDMLRVTMSAFFKAHTTKPEDQADELSDAFAYKSSAEDRVAVEQKRMHLIQPR